MDKIFNIEKIIFDNPLSVKKVEKLRYWRVTELFYVYIIVLLEYNK